jgi:TM2 domain-containing membrane protein YozV
MPKVIEPAPAQHEYSAWAGFLSYVVPGLGQIYQGRVGKGLLFLVCLYGLFFYGMALGSWKNVFLPDTARLNNPWGLPTPLANLYNRMQFAGQFWIGAAAWPAVWQYLTYDDRQNGPRFFGDFERTPPEEAINKLQQDGDKTWDLGWVYTVIAGVLNILVIYDAFAGPAFGEGEQSQQARREEAVAA